MKMRIYTLLTATAMLLTASCSEQTSNTLSLIPAPAEMSIAGGGMKINTLSSIELPEEWEKAVATVTAKIESETGVAITLNSGDADITITKDSALSQEGYTLIIDKDITITASTEAGAIYAMQTLRQMMLASENGKIARVTIADEPRFEYRGLMIDCSRHFWSVDELKDAMDNLSLIKMNKLHLHLTDNNGWRMEVAGYPELVTKGTYYPNFPEMSGNYYTTEQLKDIVAYAAERNIEVIPEIDLPGHAVALLAAYPNLSCFGGEYEAYPEEESFANRKGGTGNMMCVSNPDTYKFVEAVVKALVEVFPSQYIHLGGDEVPTSVWEQCPKCQKLYKAEKMKVAGEIQDHFTNKVREIIQAHGKTMIGWDEIDDRHCATTEDVVMIWRNYGDEHQKLALERGIPMIMTPQHGCYFDWGYAGNSTRKTYEWDPVMNDVTAEQLPLIKGGQGCIWTERVPTLDRMEWMLYPRLVALAEVLWSPKESRDWDDFYSRLLAFYPVMEKVGINYFDDDAINEKEFVASPEKPALVRNARLETNIAPNYPYHAENAFDGLTNSFYWGGESVGPRHYFTLHLGEPTPTKEVKVITGDSKDYITFADLLITKDGETFEKVASFDEFGEAQAELDGSVILGVKIQITKQHGNWPVIKEIIIN